MEVHWLFRDINPGSHANNRVEKLLGEDHKSFAICNVSQSSYVWSSDEDDWTPVSSVSSPLERSLIEEARKDLFKRVMSRAPGMAEKLTTTPNDSYVFYKIAQDGTIRLLITAWGFRNYKPGPKPIDWAGLDRRETLRIIFVRGKDVLPNRKFEIVLPYKNNTFFTDENGVRDFGTYFKVGDKIDIVDDETKTTFCIVIEEGKSDYLIDVAQECFVDVSVQDDKGPIAGEGVTISYNDGQQRLITDQTGRCRCALTYIPATSCFVSVRDQEQEQMLAINNNAFLFDFSATSTEVEVIVHVRKDGKAVFNEAIVVYYGENTYNRTSDENGECRIFIKSIPATICRVQIGDMNQARELTTKEELFIFNIREDKELSAAGLVVRSCNGHNMAQYQVSVIYNNTTIDLITDDSGNATLPLMPTGTPFIVKDSCNKQYSISYTMDNMRNEYVFVLPYELRDGSGEILVRAIAKDNIPFAKAYITLLQNGNNYLYRLDDNGETRLGIDDFIHNSPISTTITTTVGHIPEISWAIEDNEYEYELREINKERKWWHLLLEIILALFLFSGLCILGYFIFQWFFN